MKKIILIGAFVLTGLLALLKLYGKNDMDRSKTLKVGFPAYWGTLVPSLQHTGYADAIMANQFEALVTSGHGGLTEPLAAKSWNISNDYRIFTFVIDLDKKFSNGQKLTSKDFKRSWEYGLKLDPKSANGSLQDVMYRVVGFEKFKDTGALEGIRAPDEQTLVIEFREPFRMALNHLSGSRMSAFIIELDKYIGTGPYIISENNQILNLIRNQYSYEDVGHNNVEVKVIPPSEASHSLQSGLIDVYALAEFANMGECINEDKTVGCFSGNEARHQTLMLNAVRGRFFQNKTLRLAIQSLVYKKLTEDSLPVFHKFNFTIDQQIYLPLQKGRLNKEEASELTVMGEKYIQSLITESQENPLYMVTSEENNWIQELLESEGIKFTANSGFIKAQNRIQMYYKTFEPDIIVMAFSVASGDPDGIYHSLGKHGSISSPMQYRDSVGILLESGRKIINLSEMDNHYREVSKETLKEVPFVHMGFSKSIVAYRKDKIQVQKKYKKRDDNKFSIYESI